MKKDQIHIILFIFFFVFILWSGDLLAQNRVEKEVCSTGVGMNWKTSEEAKAYLLTSAKREAVGQIFGEFIRSVTKVENYQLSKDDIEAYSVGFIRVEGIPEFYNGKGLGEMCVRMRAYVTDGDLARFKAREVKKKVCVADPRLSLGEVRQIAEKQSRIQAVKDFEPKLEKVEDEVILKLIHESKTLDGGFVPDTTTYCTTASGVVYPIELTMVNESKTRVMEKVKVDEPKGDVIEKAKTDSPRPEEEMDKALKDLIGKNLLINPGAEEGLRGWAANTRSYGTRRNDPHPAHGGSWYFFPGAYKGVAVLSQVVDLKPFVTLINKRILGYTVRGYMRDHVGSRGYKDDTTQIVLSFFSEKGKVISKIMSEEVAVSAHWVEFEKSDVIPLGAVGAKLELLSRYRHGAENNDGYFDDLYFGMSRLGNR